MIILPLLFAAGGYYLENAGFTSPVRRTTQSRTIPVSILRFGAMGKIFRELSLTRTVTAGPEASPSTAVADLQSRIFPRKRKEAYFWKGQPRPYLYEANPGRQGALPSSAVIRAEHFHEGWPLISVVVSEEDLYDGETGIIPNRTRKGRNWERLADVSYFDEGKLVFASSAGVRHHAGHRNVKYLRGVRLYFRNLYGVPEVHSGAIFEGTDYPIRTLVIREAEPYVNSLAFDIARRAGARAPEMKPVMFYLNGEYRGVYGISKHLSRRQLKYEAGHDDFLFFKYKSANDRSDSSYQWHFNEWAKDRSRTMTLARAATNIDLDNYFRFIMTIMFCGETDWRQGIAVWDYSRGEPRWRWTNWDMDHSFLDHTLWYRKELKREPWEQESIEILMTPRRMWSDRPKKNPDTRLTLFIRLLEEDPSFIHSFARLTAEILNHRLTEDFLLTRAAFYQELARRIGDGHNVEKFETIKEMLRHRGDFFLKRLQDFTGGRELHTVEVRGPGEALFRIDGYPETVPYRGRYFEGDRISVEVGEEFRARFSHWLVDGSPVHEARLERAVDEALTIEAVVRKTL